jgi:sialic acid synthase SpsE
LKNYQNSFEILTGYSDHSPGPVVSLGAVSLGAVVIEKHFTLDKNDKGPDHPHSMNPVEFKLMVDQIRDLEKALGNSRKVVVEEESETVFVQRRSLYINKNLQVGDTIKEEDIIVLRPALGIPPKFKNTIIGSKLKTDIKEGFPIFWDNIL